MARKVLEKPYRYEILVNTENHGRLDVPSPTSEEVYTNRTTLNADELGEIQPIAALLAGNWLKELGALKEDWFEIDIRYNDYRLRVRPDDPDKLLLDPSHLALAKKLEGDESALTHAFMSLILILSIESNPLDNPQETVSLGSATRQQIQEAISTVAKEINQREVSTRTQ